MKVIPRVSELVIRAFAITAILKISLKTARQKIRNNNISVKTAKRDVLIFTVIKLIKKNINPDIILLTKEGLGIRSTARVLKISTTTLLKRILKIAKAILQPEIFCNQSYELDKMRFFIGHKSNPMWLVYAVNKTTKEMAGFYVGKRTNKTLNQIIKTLINSKAEKIFTDKLKNYKYLIPQEIHSTKRFATNTIERINLNIRTHLKRFNRRTICFTKSRMILNAILKIYFWT